VKRYLALRKRILMKNDRIVERKTLLKIRQVRCFLK